MLSHPQSFDITQNLAAFNLLDTLPNYQSHLNNIYLDLNRVKEPLGTIEESKRSGVMD